MVSDYLFVSKGKFRIREFFSLKNGYQFAKGWNPAAIIAVACGLCTYLIILNPLTWVSYFTGAKASKILVDNPYSDAEFAAPTADDAEGEEPARVLRGDSLADFIEWVRLRTDLDAASDDGHAVTLMTVHSSKGLEFDCVFVAGMEESLFPHMNSMMDAGAVEEERRLAYVAITRARKYLYLTCASQRQLFGSTHVNPQSRFLREIPEELRKTSGVGSAGFSGTGWEKRGSRRGISGSGTEAGEGRVFGRSSAFGSGERARNARTGLSDAAQKKSGAATTFAKGDAVDHKTFGRGTVTRVDGDTIYVKFSKLNQTKKLLKDYAPIVKINS